MSLTFRAISDKPNLIKFDFLQAEQIDFSPPLLFSSLASSRSFVARLNYF
jgi:hypothetical protein